MIRHILLFSLTWLFASVIGKAKLPNGYPGGPKEITISVIDVVTANELFQKFKSDRKIPFRYPIDGCYARATAMTEIAKSLGVNLGRINIEGDLQVFTKLPSFPEVQWGWHVAPIGIVMGSDGKKQKMVFDPALFDKPVTQKTWVKAMLKNSSTYKTRISDIYYGNPNQYWQKRRGKEPAPYKENYKDKPYTDDELGDYAAERVMATYYNFQDPIEDDKIKKVIYIKEAPAQKVVK